MDFVDVFRQLTTGVTFSNSKRKINSVDSKKNHKKIKEESNSDCDELNVKIEEEDFPTDTNCDNQIFNDVKIKKEISDDNESDDESNFKLIDKSNIQFPTKRNKKSDEKNINQIKKDEVNHTRNIHHIHVKGKRIPEPIKNLTELMENHKLSSLFLTNMKKCEYFDFTPIQMQAVPIMLNGKSVLACAPTGSGKTAAFLIPIIKDLKNPQNKGFRALILCPTRELAKQTQRECLRLTENMNFRIHIMSKMNQANMKYGEKSSKKYDILITTPKRACFLLNHEPPLLDLSNIEWLILDEADKLFEITKNSFRQQFDEIFNACTSSKKKVGLFSATHSIPVVRWAKQNLKNYSTVIVGQKNSATDLVHQELLFVGSESGKLIACRNIIKNGLHPPVLIFVQSKDRAQQLFNELIYDGINVDVIHAERTQQQRDNVVKAFREGKIWVLICTELMSRGIDFKGVNLVINYDFPPSTISYIHRIGRTGRAGQKGKAITLFTQNDTPNLRAIASIIKNSGGSVPDYTLAMKKMTKRERRKIEKSVPIREPIVTNPYLKMKKLREMKKNLKKSSKTKTKKSSKGKIIKVKKSMDDEINE